MSLFSHQTLQLFQSLYSMGTDMQVRASECLHCILGLQDTGLKKERLKIFFENLPKHARGERKMVALSAIYELLTCPQHALGNTDLDTLRSLFAECGIFPFLIEMLTQKPDNEKKDESAPDDSTPFHCYYAASIIAWMCASKANSQPSPMERQMAKQAYRAGVIKPLIDLASGERSFLEQIRSVLALICMALTKEDEIMRELLLMPPHHKDIVPILVYITLNSRFITMQQIKKGLEYYQVQVLAEGIDELPTINPASIRNKEAEERALTRCYSMEENACHLLGLLAEVDDAARARVWPYHKVMLSQINDYPIMSLHDEQYFPSPALVVRNLCLKKEYAIHMLKKKFDLVHILEKLVSSSQELCLYRVLDIISVLTSHGGKCIQKVVRSITILEALVYNLNAYSERVQDTVVATVRRLCCSSEDSLLAVAKVLDPMSLMTLGNYGYSSHITEAANDIIKSLLRGSPAFKDKVTKFFEKQAQKPSPPSPSSTMADRLAYSKRCIEQAKRRKDAGNEYFKKGQFEKAIEEYEEALYDLPTNPEIESEYGLSRVTVHNNMAECYLRLEMYHEAIANATKAISLCGCQQTKALYRRAKAFEATNKLFEATADYAVLYRENPGNKKFSEPFLRLSKLYEKPTQTALFSSGYDAQPQRNDTNTIMTNNNNNNDNNAAAAAATATTTAATGMGASASASASSKSFSGAIKVCASCGKAGVSMKKCSACMQVHYCSVECQAAHWKAGHRLECKKMAKKTAAQK